MDDAKRKLAECWRDLVPWQQGMVTDAGVVHWDHQHGEPVIPCHLGELLPDPDAPANWGVWLAWVRGQLGGAGLASRGKWWFAELRCCSVWTAEYDTPAGALLELVCRHAEPGLGSLPPSVQAWWAEQQEGATDADE